MNLVDPDGMDPVYNEHGIFIGVDDCGLQGTPIFMYEDDFSMGMAHEDAMNLHSDWIFQTYTKEALESFFSNYLGLPFRPDWDGVVTIEEGIQWAKSHPGASKNPTPYNTLYIDTSKLDFGNLTVNEIIKNDGNIQLFNLGNTAISLFNKNVRNTVYALGQVGISIVNQQSGTITINNGKGTDYDWDTGGKIYRDILVRIERWRAGLNDSHGFKAFYYGTGKLRANH